MQERLAFLFSIFAAIGRRRSSPNLADLTRATGYSAARMRHLLRPMYGRAIEDSVLRTIAAASANTLGIDARALLAFLRTGDPTILPTLQELYDRYHADSQRDIAPWAMRLYDVLSPFGASGLHNRSAIRPARKDLAEACKLPRHRLSKLARRLCTPTPEEARRICEAAAGFLQIDASRLWNYVQAGDPVVSDLISQRCLTATGCLACGQAPTDIDPLVPRQGVHRSCLRARRNPQQASWLRLVDRSIQGAPEIIRRAFRMIQGDSYPVTFKRMAAAVEIPQKDFRLLWAQAKLPRRPSGRPTNPERQPARRPVWQATVDQLIDRAPSELRALWMELRQSGRPISLRTLARAAQRSPSSLSRAWMKAGLPSPLGRLPGLPAARQIKPASDFGERVISATL